MCGAYMAYPGGARLNVTRKGSGLFLAGLLLALVPTQTLLAQASDVQVPGSLDLVVLVDESSSLSNEDVKSEIRALTSLISRRELSGDSLQTRVVVAGFGSGPSAVDEKCPPTTLTTENVQELISCAEKIRRRSASGQATDFAQAFSYASSVFRRLEGDGVARVVILLTDGKYDPRGVRKTSGLSADDIDALESSVSALRTDGAQIWPLGFGQVSENELNELAAKGARSSCPSGSSPKAVIAEDKLLGDYLLEILGAAICAGIEPPKQVPYDYFVHPLVSEVTLTIRGAVGNPSVVISSNQKEMCVDQWKQAVDGSIACQVEIAGGDSGTWTISAVGPDSNTVPTVETSQSGRVDLRLSECDPTGAIVTVSRIDNSPINWTGEGVVYPNILVLDASTKAQVGALSLTSDEQKVAFNTDLSGVQRVEVALESNQSEFIWLTASTDTCDFKSTTAEPVMTSPANSSEVLGIEAGESGESGRSWLWFLLLPLAAIVAWIIWRRISNGKFPQGTELRQRNVLQNPAANWNTRADLSGRREVSFTVDRNGWLIESTDDETDPIVLRIRPRSKDDFVVIQPPMTTPDGISTEGIEAPHGYMFEGDHGAGIALRGTFIRVDIPRELDDEHEDDE